MQEYKFLQRALTAGSTSKDAQNAQEFASYLNVNYLEQGYKLLSVTLLRVVTDPEYITEWVYHLVKEYHQGDSAEKPTKAKKAE